MEGFAPEGRLYELPDPLPPGLERFRLAGEKFWASLRAMDWGEYLATVRQPDRAHAIEAAMRDLILTTGRLIVFTDEGHYAAVGLSQVKGVAVIDPPGLPVPGGEAVLRVHVFEKERLKQFDFSTGRLDAERFMAKLNEYRAYALRDLYSQLSPESDQTRRLRPGRSAVDAPASGAGAGSGEESIPAPGDQPPDDPPPGVKLSLALSMANNWGVLGDPPSDSRLASALHTLNEAVGLLALAHIDRLRGVSGWEETAEMGWHAAMSVEQLAVLNIENPPFDLLGPIELALEAVADALLNAKGQEQEEKRRMAVVTARIAVEKLQTQPAASPYAMTAAQGALLLSEGSFATEPPPR